MSRIGRLPVKIPKGVKVSLQDGRVLLEGPKGKFTQEYSAEVSVKVEGDSLVVDRIDDSIKAKSMHGLYRNLLKNSLIGLSTGFAKVLLITGVGYKAEVKGKQIHFALGYSHPVVFDLPEGIVAEVDAKQTKLVVRGVDKHLLGLTAAKIRSLRKPEPYKGKGIKYAEERVRRKEGKTGAA